MLLYSQRSTATIQITLWQIGSTKNISSLKKIGEYNKLVFKDRIDDNLAGAYNLHNLKHSTAYKVMVELVFSDSNQRTLEYWPSLMLPNGELKNIQSEKRMFNTASMPVDEYIEQELDFARQTKRQLTRKIQFAKSERVLYDYTQEEATYDMFKKKTDHANKETLKQSMLAARGHKDWKDYARCGMKVAQPEYNKDKRLNRMLLVGNAIDAYQDVPELNNGQAFMKNDWKMGPFYAWDHNYLKYTPDDYRNKE
ncbi:UNKNOWN [Stylonychia lemnae]|uniref:Uncharacterized protein n=1 Tax=Stylonychia lemnae TaxID=5949 RepID=A0A077ZUF1_STYLE|nr:UNKNOWN [Stylonychia lemnae]|eukprot:CDW72920.1 UNKNOWN [Stylonychia lemnae]